MWITNFGLDTKRSAIQTVLTNLAGFLRTRKAIVEQWTDAERLRVMLSTTDPPTLLISHPAPTGSLIAVFRFKTVIYFHCGGLDLYSCWNLEVPENIPISIGN